MKHRNPDDAPMLFDAPPVYVRPPFTPKMTLDEQFTAFHAANPWVATALQRLAVDLVNRGQRRLGIGMLFEVLRWNLLRDSTMHEATANSLHLNNNLRSRYARLLVQTDPRLDGVFELRALAGERTAS